MHIQCKQTWVVVLCVHTISICYTHWNWFAFTTLYPVSSLIFCPHFVVFCLCVCASIRYANVNCLFLVCAIWVIEERPRTLLERDEAKQGEEENAKGGQRDTEPGETCRRDWERVRRVNGKIIIKEIYLLGCWGKWQNVPSALLSGLTFALAIRIASRRCFVCIGIGMCSSLYTAKWKKKKSTNEQERCPNIAYTYTHFQLYTRAFRSLHKRTIKVPENGKSSINPLNKFRNGNGFWMGLGFLRSYAKHSRGDVFFSVATRTNNNNNKWKRQQMRMDNETVGWKKQQKSISQMC